MTREQLLEISRNSNLDASTASKLLDKHVYPDSATSQHYSKWTALVLGCGFIAMGIIFFFAYNWAYLHSNIKLAILEVLLICTAVPYFIKSWNPLVRKIALTTSAIVMGALFALFGQIFQTEAMAFDLTLNWTLGITLWVVVTAFAPLTLIWLALIQITTVLYFEQTCNTYDTLLLITALGLFNFLISQANRWIGLFKCKVQAPQWFLLISMIASLAILTAGTVHGIMDMIQWSLAPLTVATLAVFYLTSKDGLLKKSITPIALSILCTIIIISSVILEINDQEPGLLLLTFFILTSVVMSAKKLTHLKNQWNEKG
ncbi:MAG: DUF2157 domain-containing protein [Bacteroidota bacterium]